MDQDFEKALSLIENKLKELRESVGFRYYDPREPAEVEVNKFWFNNKTIDRIMVVLRSTGCSYYKSKQGCSMCGHYDGTTKNPVKTEEYLEQWNKILNGTIIKPQKDSSFNINNYPVLCLYNLGSFLNPEEVPLEAVKNIFGSINSLQGIKKIIIESRAEYVTPENLEVIRSVNKGLIEVGIGLESINYEVRELCHHKNMPDLNIFLKAIETLHKYDFKVLAYVNQKPPFLTEKESIEDAIATSVFAYDSGVDAVSIEPTSIQAHSLTDYLYKSNQYRVPWLWSVIETVRGIHNKLGSFNNLDLRLGGYFDEEVLSGSQGVASGVERNELFPHTTSGNCDYCNKRVIEAVKEFNRTYNPYVLYNEPLCEHCISAWNTSLKLIDQRSIPKRIIHILGEK